MAELQSHILNDVALTTRVSDSDQIVQFVEASIRETSADVPDMSKLDLTYRSTEEEKKIALSYDGRELGSIDASDFVKDGMISDVSYDEATHTLSILWNSDGGSKVTEANLSGLLDTYTAGEGLTCDNGVFSLTAEIPSQVSDLQDGAELIDAANGARLSAEAAYALADTKRGQLDRIYAVPAEVPDVWDKWTVDCPVDRFSTQGAGIILAPFVDYEDPESEELRWIWTSRGGFLDKAVTLTWDGESKWKMTASESTAYLLSAEVEGDFLDKSISFTDGSDQTWTVSRASVADKLALDGEIKQWTEERGYLTEHQSLSDYYSKFLLDPCLSAVRQYDSPQKVPLSAVVNAIWCLSKLQQWSAE